MRKETAKRGCVDLLCEVRRELADAGIENARREAAWIIEHVTGLPRDRQLLEPGREISRNDAATIREFATRRAGGEPLQYILGEVDFRGWILTVGPGVLIPRPETELLVDLALERLMRAGMVCDMCTGSGAIAIALAAETGGASPVVGVDISDRALAYARANAHRHDARVRLLHADLFSAFETARLFQLITANPPYVSPAEYDTLSTDVREHEPREALLAMEDGTACLRRLLEGAGRHLVDGGWLISEIGEEHGVFCRDAARSYGFRDITIHQDLTGRDRILTARKTHISNTGRS